METLYDAIKNHEEEVEQAITDAVFETMSLMTIEQLQKAFCTQLQTEE